MVRESFFGTRDCRVAGRCRVAFGVSAGFETAPTPTTRNFWGWLQRVVLLLDAVYRLLAEQLTGRSVSSQSRSRSVSSSKHSVRETELPEPRVVGSRTSSVASLSSLRSAGDQAQDVPKATKPEESPSVEETPQKVELVDPVSSTSPSGTDGASVWHLYLDKVIID